MTASGGSMSWPRMVATHPRPERIETCLEVSWWDEVGKRCNPSSPGED